MSLESSFSHADDLVLHETAAEWLVRRQDPTWEEADEAKFQAWLGEHPTHVNAFQNVSRTLKDLTELPRPQLLSDAAASQPRPPRKRRMRRRLPLAVAAAMGAALGIGSGFYCWFNIPQFDRELATGVGERREVELPDGSHIAINAQTALRVRYYRARREVELGQGEAFFEVAPATDRPFTVDSQRSRITVVGTAFNVRNAPGEVVIKVLHGHVRVQPDSAMRGPMLSLRSEQGLSVTTATAAYHSIASPASSIAGWRRGRLVFRSTPLDEVAQELSQYIGQPVILGQPALKYLPVSGYASTDAPAVFLRALPDVLPVQIIHTPQGGYRIEPRPVVH